MAHTVGVRGYLHVLSSPPMTHTVGGAGLLTCVVVTPYGTHSWGAGLLTCVVVTSYDTHSWWCGATYMCCRRPLWHTQLVVRGYLHVLSSAPMAHTVGGAGLLTCVFVTLYDTHSWGAGLLTCVFVTPYETHSWGCGATYMCCRHPLWHTQLVVRGYLHVLSSAPMAHTVGGAGLLTCVFVTLYDTHSWGCGATYMCFRHPL